MEPIKGLVVYYSRSGATRRVAREIAAARGWDLEELVDLRSRLGGFGYFRSALEALRQRDTILRPPLHDPERYDLVIIGTPVWNGHVASAVRTYLKGQRRWLPRVAFFCTFSYGWQQRAFREMSALAGRVPIDTLAVTVTELATGSANARIQAFVDGCTTPGSQGMSAAIASLRTPSQAAPKPLILRQTAAP